MVRMGMRVLAGKQREGVGKQPEHGAKALRGSCERAGEIEDEAAAERARDRPGKCSLLPGSACCLGQAGRLALEHGERRFRRQVAWGEPGSACRHDEP